MEPIDCPETSLINYHYGLRDNPEPRSSQESEKSLKKRRKRLQKVQGGNKDSVERKKSLLRQERAVAILRLCSNTVCSVLPTASTGHITFISVAQIY